MNALTGLGVMALFAAFFLGIADMLYVIEKERARARADR
jgi:hypothetical protein